MTKVIVDTEALRKSLSNLSIKKRAEYYGESFLEIHRGNIGVPWARKYVEPQFGTEPKKMARRTDIETSHAAAKSLDTTKYEKEVYLQIVKYGKQGCTASDLIRDMSKAENSVSPRIAPLIRKGFIFDTGQTRLGSAGRKQRVVVAKEFYDAKDNN
mgnify:CR=1 FL=1